MCEGKKKGTRDVSDERPGTYCTVHHHSPSSSWTSSCLILSALFDLLLAVTPAAAAFVAFFLFAMSV